MNLVTVQEAMNHLRYEEEPAGLSQLISAASSAVLNYLGNDVEHLELSSAEIKQACLIWLGEMDQNREGLRNNPIDSRFGYGYPPDAVIALLAPLRCPRMA